MKMCGCFGVLACIVVMMYAAACGRDQQDEPSGSHAEQGDVEDRSSQAGAMAHDERMLREAHAAINEVVRNMTDCEAVKAALPKAQREIDQAGRHVRTATGRQMVMAMRLRMRRAKELCP